MSSSSSFSTNKRKREEDGAPTPLLSSNKSDVLRFLSSSSVVADIVEDAVSAAVNDALAPLGYPPASTNRWLSVVAACPPNTDPNDYECFHVFLGPWHPALSTLSLSDLVGAWHVCHFLGKDEATLYTLEADILQRFAVATVPIDAKTVLAASGELEARLTARWRRWNVEKLLCDFKSYVQDGGMFGTNAVTQSTLYEISAARALGRGFPGVIDPEYNKLRQVATGVIAPNCAVEMEMLVAAAFGQYDRLLEAIATRVPYTASTILFGSAMGGHKRIFDHIMDNPALASHNWLAARSVALRHRRREVYGWCDKKHSSLPNDEDELFRSAILARDASLLEWLSDLVVVTRVTPLATRKLAPGPEAWRTASITNQVDAIKYLIKLAAATPAQAQSSSGGIFSAIQAAAQLEHVEILQLLRACTTAAGLDARIAVEVTAPLARRGHLSALTLLRSTEPPYPWGPCVVAAAAGHGRKAVIEFLRSADDRCPWDATATAACIWSGEVELLKT